MEGRGGWKGGSEDAGGQVSRRVVGGWPGDRWAGGQAAKRKKDGRGGDLVGRPDCLQ